MSNIYLIIAGIGIFFLISQLWTRQTFRVQILFREEKENRRKKSSSLSKLRIMKYVLPDEVIKEAKRCEWPISEKEYWRYVFFGGFVAVLIGYAFQMKYFSWILFAAGFIIPRVMLHMHKRKYKVQVEEKLMAYMKALANAMPVFGNAVHALESVAPLLQEPVKQEVERATTLIQSGKSVEFAFQEMNEKYGYKELAFFHSTLNVAHLHGGEFYHTLVSTADEFEHKKLQQKKLNVALLQPKKAYTQNVLFLIGIVCVYKFLFVDIYNKMTDQLLGKVVLGIIIVSIFYGTIKVERISRFDSDEAIKKS